MDNSVTQELKRVITWQYDNATNLVSIVMSMESFFDESTKKFWDSWIDDVVNVDTANDFGLAVWGTLIGVKRFTTTVGGVETPISTEFYRKIIKARFKLLEGNASLPDYCEFVNTVFDGEVTVIDGLDMSLAFEASESLSGEQLDVFTNHMDEIVEYPTGVHDNDMSDSNVFCLDGQQPLTATDPNAGGLDNSSFAWRNFS